MIKNKVSSCKIYKIKSKSKTFKGNWNSMRHDEKQYECQNQKSNEEDPYFKDIPITQEFLTEKNQVYQKKIDYTKYSPNLNMFYEKKDPYECFHGILLYIYYYSENKFNINELEFHFSGGHSHRKYSTPSSSDQTNILHLFNYEKIDEQFTIKPHKSAFFGVTFKRIKVNPIGYSIRSGPRNNRYTRLISFVFKGYDEKNNQWDVLDERVNNNTLLSNGGYDLFNVHSTSKYYSSFKIEQTEPGSNGNWGFSISAFDIHGIISLKEIRKSSKNKTCINEENMPPIADHYNNYEYDPMMDMSVYL